MWQCKDKRLNGPDYEIIFNKKTVAVITCSSLFELSGQARCRVRFKGSACDSMCDWPKIGQPDVD
jgi:hypothetical protein